METKVKNRTWVKDAAIIFLAVLLVLTFFSSTILNASLTEVATQAVKSGTITAKVRGTGKVVANGSNKVKSKGTVTIAKVMVKTGEEVSAGDILFVLGAGDSDELEAAKEKLFSLQTSYDSAVAGLGGSAHNYDNVQLRSYKAKLDEAKAALDRAELLWKASPAAPEDVVKKAKEDLDAAEAAMNALIVLADAELARLTQAIKDGYAELDELLKAEVPDTERIAIVKAQIEADEYALANKTSPVFAELETAQAQYNTCKEYYESLLQKGSEEYTAYMEAKAEYDEAKKEYDLQAASIADSLYSESRSNAVKMTELSSLEGQIERQKEKIKELAGEGDNNVIEANTSGTVTEINCASGDTVIKDDILAVIEVADMGYTVSFSVTNDQARRLKVGDEATISNFYWGNEIKATLKSIATDKENPQNKKLLTFDLEGNVTAGSELTVSVGQKSANYDLVVPNSAIRSDNNGKFVLTVSAKNSPLGNRYFAKRVKVDILAEDDTNSAVTAELDSGDFVITTASAPVSSGDQVRLADSTN